MHKNSKDELSRLLKMMEQSLPEPSAPSQQCLRSLSFPKMDDRSNDVDRATKGTCKWLLLHETYKKWAACDRDLLWIQGRPGSGKSTLLRYILDDAIVASSLQDPPVVLSFFFHGCGEELQKSPLGLFRSLLHQLLRHFPDAFPGLVTTCQDRCKNMGEPDTKWQWHPNELRAFLKSSFSKALDSRPVWLFIDALDECGDEDAVKLVEYFKSLLQELPYNGFEFRICFTCRYYPIINRTFKYQIFVEKENGQDISTSVETRLPESLQPTIPVSIMQLANGVFLWARLIVEMVLRLDRNYASQKTIELRIKAIPSELNQLYDESIKSKDIGLKEPVLRPEGSEGARGPRGPGRDIWTRQSAKARDLPRWRAGPPIGKEGTPPSPRKIFPSHLLLRRLTAGPAEFGLFRPRPVGDAISIAPRTRSLRPLVRCIGAPDSRSFRTSLQ